MKRASQVSPSDFKKEKSFKIEVKGVKPRRHLSPPTVVHKDRRRSFEGLRDALKELDL